MKKAFIILIAVLAFIVLAAIVGGVVVFVWTGPAKKVAVDFIDDVRQGKINEALILTTQKFQNEYKDAIQQFYDEQGDLVSQIVKININNVSILNDSAEASGYVEDDEGTIVPVSVKMVKEQGQWRVYNFVFDFGAAAKK